MPNITTPFLGTDGATRANFNNKIADINTHGNDAVAHVTQADHDKINGSVQGNTKAWVATAVSYDSTNSILNLTIPKFVYSDGCQVTFKAPVVPSTSEWFSIGIDTYYFIRTIQCAAMSGDEWAIGAEITLTLSTVNVPLSTGNTTRYTAFFQGRSKASDTTSINSALTLSTVAPSSTLAIGKLWGVY